MRRLIYFFWIVLIYFFVTQIPSLAGTGRRPGWFRVSLYDDRGQETSDKAGDQVEIFDMRQKDNSYYYLVRTHNGRFEEVLGNRIMEKDPKQFFTLIGDGEALDTGFLVGHYALSERTGGYSLEILEFHDDTGSQRLELCTIESIDFKNDSTIFQLVSGERIMCPPTADMGDYVLVDQMPFHFVMKTKKYGDELLTGVFWEPLGGGLERWREYKEVRLVRLKDAANEAMEVGTILIVNETRADDTYSVTVGFETGETDHKELIVGSGKIEDVKCYWKPGKEEPLSARVTSSYPGGELEEHLEISPGDTLIIKVLDVEHRRQLSARIGHGVQCSRQHK